MKTIVALYVVATLFLTSGVVVNDVFGRYPTLFVTHPVPEIDSGCPPYLPDKPVFFDGTDKETCDLQWNAFFAWQEYQRARRIPARIISIVSLCFGASCLFASFVVSIVAVARYARRRKESV